MEESSIFFSGDVQTTAIAMVITGSLCCSVMMVIAQLYLTQTQSKSVASEKNKNREHVALSENCMNRSQTQQNRMMKPNKRNLCHLRSVNHETVINHLNLNSKLWFWHSNLCWRRNLSVNYCDLLQCEYMLRYENRSEWDRSSYDEPLVDLSYQSLKKCPDRIGFLGTHIKCLDLSNNDITELPSEISLLQGLEQLVLYNSKLHTLPESIGSLSRLRFLTVQNNYLTHLPESIGSLKKMKYLNVCENSLFDLPLGISELQDLEDLYVGNNKLKALPESLFNIHSLEILDLHNNALGELPASIGNLANLLALNVSGCQLVTLPPAICRCHLLTYLIACSNRIVELPDHIGCLMWLVNIELDGNRLKYLPATFSKHIFVALKIYQNPMFVEVEGADLKTVHIGGTFPSLKELSAREIAQSGYHNIKYLPQFLQELFS